MVPGLWVHKKRPIQFTLVVDDNFSIKYERSADARHLINVLKQHYDVTEDWKGKIFDWDYNKRQVHLSMPY